MVASSSHRQLVHIPPSPKCNRLHSGAMARCYVEGSTLLVDLGSSQAHRPSGGISRETAPVHCSHQRESNQLRAAEGRVMQSQFMKSQCLEQTWTLPKFGSARWPFKVSRIRRRRGSVIARRKSTTRTMTNWYQTLQHMWRTVQDGKVIRPSWDTWMT